MNIQRANFQDILGFYFERRTVEDASQVLEQMIAGREHLQLANLLRDHHRKSVYSKRERYLRACIDDLLLSYNILEIGTLTQFIPNPDGSEFWLRIQRVLENKHVRRYYEEYYPLRLPQLLLWRLKQGFRQFAEDDSTLANAMLQFLALDKGFTMKLNNSYLFSMLDSFTIQGYRFRNVVELISEPEIFVKRMFLPPEKCSIPDIALHELSQFFQFSIDLDEFLRYLNGHPLLQSEVWNHYSYWFERIGDKLHRKLGSALDEFLGWRPVESNERAVVEIQEYVARARFVIETLTSREYCRPVELAIESQR